LAVCMMLPCRCILDVRLSSMPTPPPLRFGLGRDDVGGDSTASRSAADAGGDC
jgi:hypothetical protein